MNGILLVDKPAGWTSHDVVAKVRGKLKAATGQKIKVGHTGTLDPMATGLLVLVIGSYTKKASDFSKLDKVYEAEITLGANSSTGDAEGDITPVNLDRPAGEVVKKVIQSFVGEQQQLPPAFSAIKIKGKKAYELARQGQPVGLEPRQITIHSITDLNYEYPRLNFTAKVSSGTYIRSLAADIGQKLGTGAYLSGLKRISVGNHKLSDAVPVDDIGPKVAKTP
jgi:tRNA pseudouridine55 synthase